MYLCIYIYIYIYIHILAQQVVTAARMCHHSEVGKVQISESLNK
jgi:hypothetical protein